jgi:hypothetical protein
MRRLPIAVSVISMGLLSGCAGVPVAAVFVAAQGALAVAADAYCASTTEEARQALRDKATGGMQVVPCE